MKNNPVIFIIRTEGDLSTKEMARILFSKFSINRMEKLMASVPSKIHTLKEWNTQVSDAFRKASETKKEAIKASKIDPEKGQKLLALAKSQKANANRKAFALRQMAEALKSAILADFSGASAPKQTLSDFIR